MPASLVVRRALTDASPVSPLRSGPVPAFTLADLDGARFSSGSLRGRPAVVHFWGSWCEQCRKEVGVLAAARRAHPEVAVVGILFRDQPAEARRAAQDLGVGWPLLVDPDEEAAGAFGVDSAPATFFVDAGGRITGLLVGPVSTPLVERQLERIL